MGDELETMLTDRLRIHWMPGDWFPCSPEAVAHYAAKARVCREYQPARVIEIGTRCGYSLAAFHAVVPAARFFCIDGAVDQDSPACLDHWHKVVEQLGIDAELVVTNSHDLRAVPPADFAHVDGDHSYEGALADLRLVADVPVILADDCDNDDVRRAVEQFCVESGRTATYYADGLRTAAVIVEE